MKLSKLMLKGADITERKIGGFYDLDSRKKKITLTCALGAVEAGRTEGKYTDDLCYGGGEFKKRYPILRKLIKDYPKSLVPKPLYGFFSYEIIDAIVKLNDEEEWSRKAIALWIESLEDYEASQQRQVEDKISKEETAIIKQQELAGGT